MQTMGADPYADCKTDEERQAKYQELLKAYEKEKAECYAQEEKRTQRIFNEKMRIWEYFGSVYSRMDARFDSIMTAIAGGSFGVSFTVLNLFISPAKFVSLPLLFIAWGCFAGCLVVIAYGHLFSAKYYRAKQNEVAANMSRLYKGEPEQEQKSGLGDIVALCNTVAVVLFTGGIVCLLLFVAKTFLQYQ